MALTITISSTRSISVTGRLVAGETASVTVSDTSAAALYVCDADREVVASCESFTAGVGSLNMATEQIATIVAEIPAGRMFCLAAQIQDADGAVIGYGFLPVVSAPMPDDLEDASVDYYVRAPQLAAAFDASQSYAVGDLVTYGGLLYTCTTAHTGEFDADDFTETTVAEAIAAGGGGGVTVDSELNPDSTNPVQNKAIALALAGKADTADINDAALTIQRNGTTIATFTANDADATTANITVPTTVAELTDAGDYLTDSEAASTYVPLTGTSTIDGNLILTGDLTSASLNARDTITTSLTVNSLTLAQHLRYPFAASTALANNSTITLADRTNTPATCAVSGAAITVSIAASQSGYMRDLLFVLDCSALDPDTDSPPTLAWADADGGSVEAFDASDSDSVDLTAEAGETIVYLVTEMASGRLVVARHILTEAAS